MFLNFLTLRQLHPDGGGPGMSLEELEADQITNPGTDPDDDPNAEDSGFNPNETDEEKETRLAEEKEATEQKKLDDEQAKQDALDQKKTDAEKAKADKAEKEAADLKAKADAEAAGNQEPDEADAFWGDVDKLRGGTLEVDFGDTDPLSPEGILLYEQAVREDELKGFDTYMAAEHPKVYALMEHVLNGGKYEDFISKVNDTITLPSEAEIENDQAVAKSVLELNLRNKGLSDKKIDALVKAAIADDTLEEDAKAALKEEQERDQKKLDTAKAETQQMATEKAGAIKQMKEYVNAVVATGEIDGLIIPEKDRPLFAEMLRKNIRYDDGKFFVTTEVTQENVNRVFRKEFFDYKGGNLKDLVEKAAMTANTNRLRKTINGKTTPKGESASGETQTTLGDVE